MPTLGPLMCFLIHPTLDGWLEEDPSVCRLVHSGWKLAQRIFACPCQLLRKGRGTSGMRQANGAEKMCKGMVQICTSSSTDMNSPNLSHALTQKFFPCSPRITLNSAVQKLSVCVQFQPSPGLLNLSSRTLKGLGLDITKSVLMHCICQRLVPGSPVCWATLKGGKEVWGALPDGAASKKTNINLSPSSGQSQ